MQHIARRAVLSIAGAGIAVALVSCQASGPFDRVKGWARRLRLGAGSHVQVRDYHGSTGFSSDPPTLLLLTSGSADAVMRPTLRPLSEFGFERDETGSFWQRTRDDEQVSLHVAPMTSGDSFFFPQAGRRIGAKGESTLLWLYVSK